MLRRPALLAAPLLLLLLAGCVPTPDGGPSASPSGSGIPTPRSTSTSGASSTSTPSSAPTSVPVTIACDALISAQQIYDFNPNFSLLATFTPSTGSVAAEAIRDQGIACRWVNQTSGETIDVTVVHFDPAGFDAKSSEVSASSRGASQFNGYFDVSNGVGEADVFSAPYWITASSKVFAEAGDVAPLVSAAVTALG